MGPLPPRCWQPRYPELLGPWTSRIWSASNGQNGPDASEKHCLIHGFGAFLLPFPAKIPLRLSGPPCPVPRLPEEILVVRERSDPKLSMQPSKPTL
jgi:hypothetical protein